jgi:dimeric dUTPase (all-alpha-NTP-PPase superfamily)
MVTLEKLFPLQDELDKKIESNKSLNSIETFPKKILAFLVELGELVNEVPEVVKFWSDKQVPKTKKVAEYYATFYNKPLHMEVENPRLEEYVDGLCFILSLGIEIGIDPKSTYQAQKKNDITLQLIHLFYEMSFFTFQSRDTNFIDIVELYLGLGEMLGYDYNQIEQAYIEKNLINHKRQEEGY